MIRAVVFVVVVALWAFPGAASAATCSDYTNQRDAQLNKDTRDADGDGIYCESLPCPCSTAGGGGGTTPTPAPAPKPKSNSCTRPAGVVRLVFSAAKYPHIKAHALKAIRLGWPRVLVVNRPGADARRDHLLEDIPTKAGNDRDEYPPAVGRGRANGNARGLVRGINPTGWMAHVAYVPSAENRSHGSVLGSLLRRLCNGTRFRYAFS